MELMRQLDWKPHLIHANDWHTAPILYALKRLRASDPFYRHAALLLGLHNLPYMGAGAGPALAEFGLPPAKESPLPWWAQDMPLPLGLLSADHIVAASPTYAQEVLTEEFGCGLQDFLTTREDSLSGILNGLDVERWNPSTDPALAANYEGERLEARAINKAALQVEFGLEQAAGVPLLAMVTRMDQQKGVDLALEALRLMEGLPGRFSSAQVIILGTGDPHLEDAARSLEADFPAQARAAVRFDTALSHRIYGGADILLIPSRYEPCGLTQMIAMRYGCVPVARATGGLRDTIQDCDATIDSTGFLFAEASPEALAAGLRRALFYYADTKAWRGLQLRGMKRDFSWQRFARQYAELYRTLVERRQMI